MDDLKGMLQGFLQSEEGLSQLQSVAEMLGLSGSGPSLPEKQSPELLPSADGIDPKKLMAAMDLFRLVSADDHNTVFLRSLKPLLRPERQPKVDLAIRFLQLMTLWPHLKESGLLGDILGTQ